MLKFLKQKIDPTVDWKHMKMLGSFTSDKPKPRPAMKPNFFSRQWN